MAVTHYIDNVKFLESFKEYKQQIKDAENSGKPKPKLPNYISESILKIAKNLAYKHIFINYTYKDEMIGDGIENCLRYVDNFDPEKSSNPFAYFTQINYYAFIRRIKREQQQSLIKAKMIMDSSLSSFVTQSHDGDDPEIVNSYRDFIQSMGVYENILAKEEQKLRENKAKKPVRKSNVPTLDDMFTADE